MTEYIAFVEYDKETGTCGVIFPDLPGCTSAGNDFDEAFRMAHEALSLYAEDNPVMPEPRSLERIQAEWEDWSDWQTHYRFYVTKIALYPLRVKTKKFNISLDERLVRRIDRVTNNRSSFIAAAVEQMLRTD